MKQSTNNKYRPTFLSVFFSFSVCDIYVRYIKKNNVSNGEKKCNVSTLSRFQTSQSVFIVCLIDLQTQTK